MKKLTYILIAVFWLCANMVYGANFYCHFPHGKGLKDGSSWTNAANDFDNSDLQLNGGDTLFFTGYDSTEWTVNFSGTSWNNMVVVIDSTYKDISNSGISFDSTYTWPGGLYTVNGDVDLTGAANKYIKFVGFCSYNPNHVNPSTVNNDGFVLDLDNDGIWLDNCYIGWEGTGHGVNANQMDSLRITNCLFDMAGMFGLYYLGVNNVGGVTLELYNNTFISGAANYHGGGLYLSGDANYYIQNNVFDGSNRDWTDTWILTTGIDCTYSKAKVDYNTTVIDGVGSATLRVNGNSKGSQDILWFWYDTFVSPWSFYNNQLWNREFVRVQEDSSGWLHDYRTHPNGNIKGFSKWGYTMPSGDNTYGAWRGWHQPKEGMDAFKRSYNSRVWYVSEDDGSDLNSGYGGWANAYQTLNQLFADNHIRGGDTVVVALDNSSSQSNPTSLTAGNSGTTYRRVVIVDSMLYANIGSYNPASTDSTIMWSTDNVFDFEINANLEYAKFKFLGCYFRGNETNFFELTHSESNLIFESCKFYGINSGHFRDFIINHSYSRYYLSFFNCYFSNSGAILNAIWTAANSEVIIKMYNCTINGTYTNFIDDTGNTWSRADIRNCVFNFYGSAQNYYSWDGMTRRLDALDGDIWMGYTRYFADYNIYNGGDALPTYIYLPDGARYNLSIAAYIDSCQAYDATIEANSIEAVPDLYVTSDYGASVAAGNLIDAGSHLYMVSVGDSVYIGNDVGFYQDGSDAPGGNSSRRATSIIVIQ